MRVYVILGIFLILICVGVVVYSQIDMHKFKQDIGEPPIAETNQNTLDTVHQSVEAVDVPIDYNDEDYTEDNLNNRTEENTVVEDTTDTDQSEIEFGKQQEVSEKDEEHEDGVKLSEEEVKALFYGIASFEDPYPDEKLDLLEQVLEDKLGDNPKIPEFIDTFKALHTVGRLAKETMTGDNDNAVSEFLNKMPALVIHDFIEVSIELFDVSDEEAEKARAQVDQFAQQINSVEIIEEMRPFVQQAVDDGEMTSDEALEFLETVSGAKINVVE